VQAYSVICIRYCPHWGRHIPSFALLGSCPFSVRDYTGWCRNFLTFVSSTACLLQTHSNINIRDWPDWWRHILHLHEELLRVVQANSVIWMKDWPDWGRNTLHSLGLDCSTWCRHNPLFAWGTALIGAGTFLPVWETARFVTLKFLYLPKGLFLIGAGTFHYLHEVLSWLEKAHSIICIWTAMTDVGMLPQVHEGLPSLVQAHSSICVRDCLVPHSQIPQFVWAKFLLIGTGILCYLYLSVSYFYLSVSWLM
jgi:hypothetical protein